jgi:hypothetical protein
MTLQPHLSLIYRLIFTQAPASSFFLFLSYLMYLRPFLPRAPALLLRSRPRPFSSPLRVSSHPFPP